MGRKCSVPHCYTGYRQCKEKAALYKVPDDDFFLSKWQDAIAREDRPITPRDYVCEKHFKEEDILRRRIIKDVVEEYQRPKLKPDAIPSVFPDWPEFISKMTKKRRKMPIETKDIVDMTKKSDDDSTVEQTKDAEHPTTGNLTTEIEMALSDEEIEIKTENEESINSGNQEDDQEEEEEDPLGVKMYRCDVCKYKTQYAHNLRTHKTKHLSGSNAYMHCDICEAYKTKWDSVFVNHMKTKHRISLTDVIKCSFCNFRTKVGQCLVRHHDMEHPGQAIPKKALKFPRPDCEYATESKNTLNFHVVQEHRGTEQSHTEMEICDGAGTTTKTGNDAAVVETNTGLSIKKPKKVSCSRCPYKTTSQILLRKHLLKHQFAQLNNSHLSAHERGHVELDHNKSTNPLLGNNNNNKNDTVRMPNFDIVTIKEDRSDDVFVE